jgi:hypothetical protein
MEEKEKPKRTAVKVVGTKGDSALVQWGEQRGYVPVSAVKNGTVSAVTLKRAVPYGVSWDDLAEGLAAKMHTVGIWTTDDLAKNARLGFETARPFKLSLGALNTFAHKEG